MKADSTEHPASSLACPGTPFSEIDAVGLLCGPGTNYEQCSRLCALGDGWPHAVHAWQRSGAPYCFFLVHREDGDKLPFSRPIAFFTDDRRLLERRVWSVAIDNQIKACVIDSLEPSFKEFVGVVKDAFRFGAGHA
jgi:hypothetical protein